MQILLNLIQLLSLIALGVYVFKTWQIAEYNRKLMRAQASSSVIAYFDFPQEGLFVYLVIKNISVVPALNIKLNFDPKINIKKDGIELSELPAFKDGISFLAPGQELRFFLDIFPAFFEKKDLASEYSVHITHKDGLDEKFHENWMKLNIKQFYFEASTNYNENILNEMKGIKSALVEIKRLLPTLKNK